SKNRRKSVAALERQLQEERDGSAKHANESQKHIEALEEALRNSRAPVAQLRSDLEESKTQQARLESLVDRFKAEFETAQRELQEERQASRDRIQQLESDLNRKSGASDTARI